MNDTDILCAHKPQTLFIHLTSTKTALCNPCQTTGSLTEKPANEREGSSLSVCVCVNFNLFQVFGSKKMGRCKHTVALPGISLSQALSLSFNLSLSWSLYLFTIRELTGADEPPVVAVQS